MNHKKSRVTDLFRKIDRNNNGLIPREEFIDAIMKTSKHIFLTLLTFLSCRRGLSEIYDHTFIQNSQLADLK